MGYILKTTAFISAIAGLIMGILLLIPFLAPIIFFLLFIIFGVFIIIYLKKNNIAGLLSVQDGALIGAVSGCISLAAAFVIYLPAAFIIGNFFSHNAYKFGFSNSFSDFGYNIFFGIMLIFFTSLFSAMFNAFTGMITAYIYEKIEGQPLDYDFENHLHIDIEQDE